MMGLLCRYGLVGALIVAMAPALAVAQALEPKLPPMPSMEGPPSTGEMAKPANAPSPSPARPDVKPAVPTANAKAKASVAAAGKIPRHPDAKNKPGKPAAPAMKATAPPAARKAAPGKPPKLTGRKPAGRLKTR